MRPRQIFALLYRKLLKQKLQTKTGKSLRTKSTFYFLDIDNTTGFTAGFAYNLSDLTRDEIHQLNVN